MRPREEGAPLLAVAGTLIVLALFLYAIEQQRQDLIEELQFERVGREAAEHGKRAAYEMVDKALDKHAGVTGLESD